jgi:hypothetical protein
LLFLIVHWMVIFLYFTFFVTDKKKSYNTK